ncbi:MAG TPA: cytoplasmic protein [Desulfobulbaceae bacterium]|nr:cytoplasmic protein [Desulfobulbaceae bacterium]
MALSADGICFGLDHALDSRSLVIYLRLFGREECAALLAERMTSEEIIALADTLTGLMKKHFSEDEYHRHFLNEE